MAECLFVRTSCVHPFIRRSHGCYLPKDEIKSFATINAELLGGCIFEEQSLCSRRILQIETIDEWHDLINWLGTSELSLFFF